jgi:spore germination cell wall hydrolase CwlJ-like protein
MTRTKKLHQAMLAHGKPITVTDAARLMGVEREVADWCMASMLKRKTPAVRKVGDEKRNCLYEAIPEAVLRQEQHQRRRKYDLAYKRRQRHYTPDPMPPCALAEVFGLVPKTLDTRKTGA